MVRFGKFFVGLGIALSLGACGTTYDLPGIDDSVATRASKMFADAQSAPPRKLNSASAGEVRFRRVAARIMPVAKKLCEQEFAEAKDVDCNVRFEIDRDRPERNAYFTYGGPGFKDPRIVFTVPMLRDTANDHEVAFILGHEYGHLIGQHIKKQSQQAVAGALIVGLLVAYGNSQAAAAGAYYDPNDVDRGMELGAQLGQISFSQAYELESDMLGTRIAIAAGYDPVIGAQFFARAEAVRSEAGELSFWGTHPPDKKRIALVIATVEQIKANESLARKKK